MEWFKKVVFHNYANFKGRARRKEYWMFYLFYFLFIFFATIADILVFDVNVEDPEAVYPLQSIFILATFIPLISLGARRLHDVGKSGWLQLIALIPFFGAIVLLIFACTDSDPLENKYGTSPKLITSSTDVENLKSSVDGVAESHQKQPKVPLSQDEKVLFSVMECPSCGNRATIGDKDTNVKCPFCGAGFQQIAAENKYNPSSKVVAPAPNVTKVFCTQCGEPNTKDNSFCVKCGKVLT